MYQQYAILPQTKESLSHILKHYSLFVNDRKQRGLAEQPMIVGVSGCQGSGKTTLCDTLTYLLKQEPYQLRVVNFSLDDVYLTHREQLALAQRYPENKLYQQRGQAGSHDLTLATETFKALLMNQPSVSIPVYDKSLFDGQGDRLPKQDWKQVRGPFDIVLFEGWMLGFRPVEEKTLEVMYRSRQTLQSVRLDDLKVMNENLKRYETELYPYLDLFIHLSPLDIQQVYQWRLEQEHHMKMTRGVTGLSDEAVKQFVNTYMPAYELYLPQLNTKSLFEQSDKQDHHLKIVLDRERKVVQSEILLQTSNTIQKRQTGWINRRYLFVTCCVLMIGIMGYRRSKLFDSVFRVYDKIKK
ncbi:hypothetical protein CU097_009473 [Rhizopus azygosporus]|uniref:Phosphoribulokinase/uridine kinase domain-containing protein n=1 Tax=Rhizopus azygosporus TaxID=86630 RepID=A0A367JBH5_RHIAZ|nr:hypothetical protein CU097_009473 [Rhizopus azygosporus]